MGNESLKKSAMSNFLWKLAERLGAQFVSLIVTIILARILVPDDYSVISIVSIFFAFCNVFVNGGFGNALIQKKNSDIVDFSSVFYFSLAVSSCIYLLVFFLAPTISELYDKAILIPIIRVLALSIIIGAVNSVQSAYISKNMMFKKYFFATLIGTGLSAFVGIIMAIKGFGPWALVAQQLTNSFVDTLILFISSGFRPKLIFSIKRLNNLFSFGWKILVTTFISTVYSEIRPLIIGIKYSTVDLAYYSKGKQYPSLLLSSTGSALQAVLFPVLSAQQDNKNDVLRITRRFIQISSFIVFPFMLGLFAISDMLIPVLLTEKWVPIIPYIKVFCVAFMFDMISGFNLEAVKAIGRSDILLILEIIKKLLYAIIIVLAVVLFDTPIYIAMSVLLCSLLAIIINSVPNKILLKYKYRLQFADLGVNLISSVIMCLIISALSNLNLQSVLIIIVQILMGIFIYVIINALLKNPSQSYCIENIKSLMKLREKR